MNKSKTILLLTLTSILFTSFTRAQTSVELAASVVSNFPSINSDIATFFKAETSGDCYKLAGYVSLLTVEEQKFIAGRAKVENGRCFQRPSKEDLEKEKSAIKSISAAFSASATEDSKKLRKPLSVYSSVQIEFKETDEAVDVDASIKTFASVQSKANSCASNSFKRLLRVVTKRRNIIYAKLENLNSACSLSAVGTLTGASVYTNCKMSLETAREIFGVYKSLAPCLMKLQNEYITSFNKARATVSQLKQCKVDGNSNVEVDVSVSAAAATRLRFLEEEVESEDEVEGEAEVEASVENSIKTSMSNSISTTVSASVSASISATLDSESENEDNLDDSDSRPDLVTAEDSSSSSSSSSSSTSSAGIEAQTGVETKSSSKERVDKATVKRDQVCDSTESAGDGTLRQLQNNETKASASGNASIGIKIDDVLDKIKDIWKDAKGETSKAVQEMKNEIDKVTNNYKICKNSKLTFNSNGDFIISARKDVANLFVSSKDNFKITFTSNAAARALAKMDDAWNPDSGYDLSCSPIIEMIQNSFITNNRNSIANLYKRLGNNGNKNPIFYYFCEYNNGTKILNCSCQSGTCSGQYLANVSFNIKTDAFVSNFTSITIVIWSSGGATSYFAEYAIEKTDSGTTFTEKKFEYKVKNQNSNNSVCEQMVGCMKIVTNPNKSKESKESCEGKMQEKCKKRLDELNSKTEANYIAEVSLATDVIPFIDDEEPTDKFIKFASEFLVSEDGFTFGSNIFIKFPTAIAAQATADASTTTRLRNLETFTSNSSIDSDSGAQVDSASYDTSEVVVDGSTSTQSASEGTYMTENKANANLYVNNQYGENNSTRFSSSLTILVCIFMLMLF